MTTNTTSPTHDLVYIVRAGDNTELRYSLRSLKNLPHRGVWVVGDKPDWVTNVRHIQGNLAPNPRTNVYNNILAACQHPDTPDEFVVMNDDFYITEPIQKIPTWYRGTLADHMVLRPTGWWGESLRRTAEVLGRDALSYELHTPFVINKHDMAAVLTKYADVGPDNPPQWRTLYGNTYQIGGTQHEDCKAYGPGNIHTPFHSTHDSSFRRYYRKGLAEMFAEASCYER